jgi:Uma2 family endonuclease
MAVSLLRWTNELLEHMPRLEGERYEIIDGELYVTTAPHLQHQIVCSTLVTELTLWSRSGGDGLAFAGPGVIYADDEGVVPDVVWVSQARLAQIVSEDGKLHGSPELVVEVLSPGKANAERDREKKLDLYSRRGLQEYWIVDWQAATVELYRPKESVLECAATLRGAEILTSPTLPGFSCSVEEFFKF